VARDAFEQGWDAYRACKPRWANPFRLETDAALNWRDGWLHAKRQAEDAIPEPRPSPQRWGGSGDTRTATRRSRSLDAPDQLLIPTTAP